MFRSNLTLTLLIFLASSPFATPSHAFAQERVDSTPSLIEVKHKVRGSGQVQFLNEGDLLCLNVKAVGGMDVYVYVIYHDASGDSFLLFPNAKERNIFIPAGATRKVPDSASGIGFRVRAPFGKERLQVIATPQPLPELERLFKEGKPADELNEWLQWIAEQPQCETQYSEFETRPRNDEPLNSGPERVQ